MKRTEFPRVSPESVGIASESIEWLVDQLEMADYTEPHGLMVMRHGKVCAEGWWSPYAPGLRHGLQSHTKTYAATAVGIACTEGLLSLDEKVIDIFPDKAPENPSENLKKLRVRDVLCMGCGMESMPADSVNWIRDFLAVPVVHEPGTRFMYNSTGSTLLGAIVRRKTGEGLIDFLTPRLFDKIGIDARNLRSIRMEDGMEMGGGGFYATTEDNLRLMKLYADGGVWDGERILSEDYVRQATSSQNDASTEAAVNPPALDNFVGYGFQIWMCRPEGVYRADGAMGQFTIVIPSKDMIIAVNETATGSTGGLGPQLVLNLMWEFLDKVVSDGPLPENGKALAHLRQRMASLSIPHPQFAPYSPFRRRICGKTYKVRSGEFILDNGRFPFSNIVENQVESFSFDFSDGCLMAVGIGGHEYQLEVGVDGSRRLNRLQLGESPVTQLCLSGAWTADNIFEVRVRWIETCFEKALRFAFDGNSAAVTADTVLGGFAPPKPKDKPDALAYQIR